MHAVHWAQLHGDEQLPTYFPHRRLSSGRHRLLSLPTPQNPTISDVEQCEWLRFRIVAGAVMHCLHAVQFAAWLPHACVIAWPQMALRLRPQKADSIPFSQPSSWDRFFWIDVFPAHAMHVA